MQLPQTDPQPHLQQWLVHWRCEVYYLLIGLGDGGLIRLGDGGDGGEGHPPIALHNIGFPKYL
jgi:hypothetical protein